MQWITWPHDLMFASGSQSTVRSTPRSHLLLPTWRHCFDAQWYHKTHLISINLQAGIRVLGFRRGQKHMWLFAFLANTITTHRYISCSFFQWVHTARDTFQQGVQIPKRTCGFGGSRRWWGSGYDLIMNWVGRAFYLFIERRLHILYCIVAHRIKLETRDL